MGYHLVAVLLSPLLLCLLGALAAALWPARWVLWSFLAPAWVIAALTLGLVPHQHELAGPVLHWCRVDTPGLVLNAFAMPAAALLLFSHRSSPQVRHLLDSRSRFALFQAAAAGLGLLPPPCLLAAIGLLGGWSWRHSRAPVFVEVLAVLAFVCWAWPGLADFA
ncbi:MAG: hypothetical protein WAT39_18855, partial [Planctomycetota bacterium]